MTAGDNPYDDDARLFAARYDALPFEQVHRALLPHLPEAPAHVLDIGAGSGRDAAWFAWRGHEVIAVEPSAGMRGQARERVTHPRVCFIDDALPALAQVHRLGLQFDFILMSAVWMHVPPEQRRRAFRKVVTLLAPNGRLAVSLRLGPPDRARGMHTVSATELQRLAMDFGLRALASDATEDLQGRDDIRWQTLVFEYPDDEQGALPLLRHIILRDDKASTYKLALLRTLSRIADSAPGMARDTGEDAVSLPLGLVALFWVRMMQPLLAANMPQAPGNRRGGEGLSFAGEAFFALERAPPVFLRPGMRFEALAAPLARALNDAAKTITQMPVRYISYPGSTVGVFAAVRQRLRAPRAGVVIDEPFLLAFGEFLVPQHVWRSLCRLNVWIDPVLVSEWIALMQRYAASQGRAFNHDSLAGALRWLDPDRDTRLSRERALALMGEPGGVSCVWTGAKLTPDRLDVDHCFPFSAWPCSDLWNLLPATRAVNQRHKRDRLVTSQRLLDARERIVQWWEQAWLGADADAWRQRFFEEARASLPLCLDEVAQPDSEHVLEGMQLRRGFLSQTQRLPEW